RPRRRRMPPTRRTESTATTIVARYSLPWLALPKLRGENEQTRFVGGHSRKVGTEAIRIGDASIRFQLSRRALARGPVACITPRAATIFLVRNRRPPTP